MAEYLIELPHTKEECIKAGDEIKDSELLARAIGDACLAFTMVGLLSKLKTSRRLEAL